MPAVRIGDVRILDQAAMIRHLGHEGRQDWQGALGTNQDRHSRLPMARHHQPAPAPPCQHRNYPPPRPQAFPPVDAKSRSLPRPRDRPPHHRGIPWRTQAEQARQGASSVQPVGQGQEQRRLPGSMRADDGAATAAGVQRRHQGVDVAVGPDAAAELHLVEGHRAPPTPFMPPASTSRPCSATASRARGARRSPAWR